MNSMKQIRAKTVGMMPEKTKDKRKNTTSNKYIEGIAIKPSNNQLPVVDFPLLALFGIAVHKNGNTCKKESIYKN